MADRRELQTESRLLPFHRTSRVRFHVIGIDFIDLFRVPLFVRVARNENTITFTSFPYFRYDLIIKY